MKPTLTQSFCLPVIDSTEQNNLVGTIPTEVGLLSHLAVWGMEQGNLTSTIPTEIGRLTNLLYMDFDFNMLTGSFPSELYSLSLLQQLDVNDNKLTGSIDNMGAFPHMTFLQLHANLFTGTVPAAVGNYVNMTAFTLHKSHISGTMPTSVCDLLVTANKGGVLAYLIADCRGPNPTIVCTCCTDCRTPLP